MAPPAYQYDVNWYNHNMNSQQGHFRQDDALKIAVRCPAHGWGGCRSIWYYELLSISACDRGRCLGHTGLPRLRQRRNGVTDRLIADYELESPLPLEKAAA